MSLTVFSLLPGNWAVGYKDAPQSDKGTHLFAWFINKGDAERFQASLNPENTAVYQVFSDRVIQVF